MKFFPFRSLDMKWKVYFQRTISRLMFFVDMFPKEETDFPLIIQTKYEIRLRMIEFNSKIDIISFIKWKLSYENQ